MTLRVPFWPATPRIDIPPNYPTHGSEKFASGLYKRFEQRERENTVRGVGVGFTVALGTSIVGASSAGPVAGVLAGGFIFGILLGGLVWGAGTSSNQNYLERPQPIERVMFELRELMPTYLHLSFNVRSYLKFLAADPDSFRKVRVVCQIEAAKEDYRIAARVAKVPGDIGDVIFYSDDQIHIVSSDIPTRFGVGSARMMTNYPVHAWFLSVLEDRIALWPQAPKLVSIRCEDAI